MGEEIITFKDFSFKYSIQKKPTLKHIDLQIHRGEKVLILGPSGCGKSTLISCINGIVPFSHAGEITGSLQVAGLETKEKSIFQLSQYVGTVLQDTDAQFIGLSVGEDMAFSMENRAVPRPEMVERVRHNAGIVGMQEFLAHVPFRLSGGLKQTAAIGGVLDENVEILLFDEPLASLDPHTGQRTIELIDELSAKGYTVLIIEHRLEDVLHRPVDRIILMSEGEIVSDTTPDALLKSGLLSRYGIREPLYISAMKHAGCDIQTLDELHDVHSIALEGEDRKQLENFFSGEVMPSPELPEEAIIRVEHVSFAYDKKPVLRDVSFTVRKGEKIALIGSNGAGKSTMARLISGIEKLEQGNILLDGTDIKDMSIMKIGQRVGYVLQNPNQMLIKSTVTEEAELALRARNEKEAVIRQNVSEALDACHLTRYRKYPVDVLSYGQKKRVTIASVLVFKPDVLILDEPTAGQDLRSYTAIMEFMDQLNRELGVAIIFITHDLHLALEYMDRALVFSGGQLVADDSVYRVLSDSQVVKRANLKQTSLCTLAERLGLPAETVVSRFTKAERTERERSVTGNEQ